MHITVDGTRIFYLSIGPESNLPLFVLHGGPGLDHTEMHPWLDPLSDSFRLIYVDLRGHARSDRVDPSTLSLERYAEDVSAMARAMDLPRFALLGHSYGAMIALTHAVERGDASHYVISSGTASMSKSMREVHANLENFEPVGLREQVTESWDREPTVSTPEEAKELLHMQMPFHFARVDSDAYHRYMERERDAIYTPEVLAYTATHEYEMEVEGRLGTIDRPVLIMTGRYDRTTTVRAAEEMHAGIPGSELVIFPDAGHMTYVEQPEEYFAAVRGFFQRHAV